LQERAETLEASINVLRDVILLGDREEPPAASAKWGVGGLWTSSRETRQLTEQVQAMRQTLWSLSKF